MSATLLCWMLLLAVSTSSAQKTHKGIQQEIEPPFGDCGNLMTLDRPLNEIDVRNSLQFAVLPSDAHFRMELFVGENSYTVTVNETAIIMRKCEGQDQNQGRCALISAAEGTGVISTSSWNAVEILLQQNQLKVLFESREVVDNTLPVTAFRKTGYFAKVNFPAQHNVHVAFPCDSTAPTDQQPFVPGPTRPPRTDLTHPPFPDCESVNVTGPVSQPFPVYVNRTFGVYPSESMLILRINIGHSLYKAVVEGTMIDLQECESNGQKCHRINIGGTKATQLLHPYQWSIVEVLFYNGEITITINKQDNVMGRTMSTHGSEGPFEVSFVTGESEMPTTQRPGYYVVVNEDCTVPVDRAVTSGPGVTGQISDSTASPPSETGAPVGIIVGVLVALLIIIAIVVAVTIVKKRRTMQVTQHTPLQEQRAH